MIASPLLSARQARATVREEGARLALSLWAARYSDRRALVEDLKRAFPGHSDRTWRRRTGDWSFPAKHRARLLAWCAAWFEIEAVDWRAALPADEPHVP